VVNTALKPNVFVGTEDLKQSLMLTTALSLGTAVSEASSNVTNAAPNCHKNIRP